MLGKGEGIILGGLTFNIMRLLALCYRAGDGVVVENMEIIVWVLVAGLVSYWLVNVDKL